MVDGGSNCNLLCHAGAIGIAHATAARGSVGGIAGGLSYTSVAHHHASFSTTSHSPIDPITIAWLATPRGTKNILSESVLLDEYNILACKDPPQLQRFGQPICPLERRNGCWYAKLRLRAPTIAANDPLPPAIASAATTEPTAAASVRVDDAALLWAARLGLDADGLSKTARAVHGLSAFDSLTPRQRDAIAANEHRAIAQARHAPTGSTPLRDRATEPGELFVCDGYGWHHAASPTDGAHYQFSAVCEYSSYGYIATAKTHTIDDWIEFLRSVLLDARALGHNPKRLRFDLAPELRSGNFKKRVEDELKVAVELTPREHHQGVGRAERNHDTLTRMGEMMLRQANLDTQWLLPARAYAQWLLNRRAFAASGESRYQKYLRKVPDFTAMTPYIFGTTVSLVEDVHGPRGSLEHPRGSVGTFVGIDGSSYLIWRPQRKNLVKQYHLRPLNELALVRSGLPSSVATAESETQTDGEAAPKKPPARAAREPRPSPPTVELPMGTRVDVLWSLRDGAAGDVQKVWYSGRVADIVNQQNGVRRHYIAYDGWPQSQWYWHDLASDAFEWRRSEVPADPLIDAPTRPTTRSRTAARAALAWLEDALEATSLHAAADQFDATLFQAIGDAADHFPSPHEGAAGAYAAVADAAAGTRVTIFSLGRAECCKATQGVVDVLTSLGPQQFVVPGSYAKVLQSEQRDHWLAAERKALDAILARPGNRFVKRSVPISQGIPIAPCVTQRRLKVDPATKGFASNNPFKARHCVDGGRLDKLLQRAGAALDVETSSSTACDLLVKMFMADTAVRNRRLTKTDIPDAYTKGKRIGRPLTYLALPDAFKDMRDDDGDELCIELTTPMWGEGPAGFEWQVELETALAEIGWRRAEDVPALWRYRSPQGDAHLLTIVDDLLFSESDATGHSIAEATIARLAERYGTLDAVREPDSFAGYRIARADGALTLSMPQKIVEAARTHLPELLSGEPTALPDGKKLHQMADALKLPKERPAKLSRRQVSTQAITGALKFIEKLHPAISLLVHRLSCVMSCPPPEAYDVARAVLKRVYADRDGGITYGGMGLASSPRLGGNMRAEIDMSEPPPGDLEAHADATWGDRNIYALVLTFGGGVVLHCTKKIALLLDSSMECEAIASAKAAESVSFAREILRALGTPPLGPTLIGTDNLANQKVGSGSGHPQRSMHFLRRYHVLLERVRQRECTLKHVPDADMPADFLTKFVPGPKFRQSVDYLTNRRAVVKPKDDA